MKNRVGTSFPRWAAGFTMMELLVAMAISAIVLTGLLVATFSLQRSFEASNYRMTAQEDQLRMLDYVTRDLHMASGVTIQNAGTQLTATLPPVTDSALDLNLGPLLTPAVTAMSPSSTSAGGTTVTYFAEGGQFVRQVDSAQTVIADTVTDLSFAQDGSFVTVDVTFTPEFSNSPTTASQPATRATSRVFLRNIATME